jgi:hypothetical protein
MKMPNETVLKEDVARNEGRAHRAAYVLVFGLCLEVVLVAIFPNGKTAVENWGAVLADVLVAGAVFAEIHFSGNAARAQKSLQLATDAKLTDALNRTSAAQEELRKFRTPRVQLLTAENREKLLAALRPFQGTIFIVGHDNLDREVWDLLWELEPIIRQAGWIHADWQGGQRFKKQNWPEDHWYGVAGVMNVSIEVRIAGVLDVVGPVVKAAVALAQALCEVGIEAVTAVPNNGSIQTNLVTLLVGPKR